MYCDIKIKYRIKKVVVFFFYSCFSRICGKFFRGVYIVRKEIVIKENIFFFYLFSNYKLLYIFRKEDIVLVFYINIE